MRTKHASNLRLVRDATGLSQAQLAARIGTHKGNIENYEMGRAIIPERLAARIGGFVGVIPQTLQHGETPMSWDGEPFSAAKYHQWQSLGYLPRQIPILIHSAQGQLDLLLQAALGPKNNTPHLFRELLIDFNHFIHSRAERLGLTSVIESTMRANQLRTRRRKTTLGKLRAEFGSNPDWKAIDNPKVAGSRKTSIQITSYSLFRPFVGFATDAGRPAFASLASTDQQMCDVEVDGKHYQVKAERVQANYLRPRRTLSAPTPEATPPSPRSSPAPTPSPVESPKSSSPRRASRARGSA